MSSNATATPDVYTEVRYVTIDGAGGVARVYLSELIDWLTGHPGILIIGLRNISTRSAS